MSQPPPYNPVTSFITYQAQQAWFPGQQLDVEFNALKTSVSAIAGNLAFIQSDDRSLGHGLIGWDQLAPTFQLSLRAQGFSGAPVSGPNTWFGLQTFPDGVTLLPGGIETGLNVTHNSGLATVAGSSGFPFFYQASPTYVFNQIAVIDQVNVTTAINHGMSAALGIGMETGGANSQGTKVCLELQLVCDIPGANPSYGRDRACLSCDAFDSVGDGGTGTGSVGQTKGTLFAAGFQTVASAGALNLTSVAGMELDVSINTGASAWSRLGVSAVSIGNLNAVSNIDAGFEISSFSGSPAWKTGLMFSSFHGGPAVTSTGTLIGTDGVAFNAGIGIDFTGATFSSWIFKSNAFTVDNAGSVTAVNLTLGGVGTFLSWTASSAIEAPSDGVLTISNHALSDFSRLQLGGATSSFPAIKRNGAAINFRLADDSADAAITAGAITAAAITSAAITSSAAISAGAAFGLKWTGRASMFSPADGNIELTNAAAADFGLLQFGGTTSSFPAIKRSTTALRLRLADDSADAALTLSTLSSGANQVVGARATGWTVATGTPQRSTFTTSGVTLAQLAGVVMALEQDLIAHGLIGT